MNKLTISTVALLLLAVLFIMTACGRPEFKMGSGTYFVNGTAFKDEVKVKEQTYRAGEGMVFLEVEYIEIYDGKTLQNCCLDSSAFVTDATGEKYELKFSGMTVRGGDMSLSKGQPIRDFIHRLTFGPMPRKLRGLKLHVDGQEIGL
jgi:hypothetical protein